MAASKKTYGREEIKCTGGAKLIFTKLDSLEEYEEKAAELDEYAATYLMMLQDNSCVYTVTGRDLELYGDSWLDWFRVCPSVASVVQRLRYGITETHKLDPTTLPVIPIMEYKLVPTGNIYFYDPALPPEEERHKRDLWKMRQYYIKTEKSKRKKKRQEKLRTKKDETGDIDDGI